MLVVWSERRRLRRDQRRLKTPQARSDEEAEIEPLGTRPSEAKNNDCSLTLPHHIICSLKEGRAGSCAWPFTYDSIDTLKRSCIPVECTLHRKSRIVSRYNHHVDDGDEICRSRSNRYGERTNPNLLSICSTVVEPTFAR